MIKVLRFVFIFQIFLLLISFVQAGAQSIAPDSIQYRYWIYFKDKGEFKPDGDFTKGTEGYKTAISGLSDKSLKRRAKVLPENELVSYNDIAVNKAYMDAVTNLKINIHAVSKWLNAVSVKATTKQLDLIKKLDFVTRIEGVHHLEQLEFKSGKKVINSSVVDEQHHYQYGPSYWQNRQINVPVLHDCGITGYGVTVGMCDDGFNWRNHQALRNRNVKDEYDWIFKDDSVQYQFPPNQFPEDGWDQDGHGTSTMSTLGGFYNGKLIGPAFDADFYLSKTEDGRNETPVEEDYWLEGVEWMEAQGVDVISSSLIYKPFDDPNDDYNYKDMDGRTTIVVRAAEMTVHLGVVVCNSMGNERQTNPPSVVSPPDGDSVISVGAVDSAGVIAPFSSNGPTSDGRMKPDIVAMGIDCYTATSESQTNNDSTYSYSSGTSFSCPITAGVCALILSAHPELTPMQVKEALKMTANNKNTPNNIYGWGLINAYDAVLYYGPVMSNRPEFKVTDGSTIISTYIISNKDINPESVKIYYSEDGSENYSELQMMQDIKINETNSGRYTVTINGTPNKFYITAKDSQEAVSGPYNSPQKFYYYNSETKQVEIY